MNLSTDRFSAGFRLGAAVLLFLSSCDGALLPGKNDFLRNVLVVLPSLQEYLDSVEGEMVAAVEWTVRWQVGTRAGTETVVVKLSGGYGSAGHRQIILAVPASGAEMYVVHAVPVLLPQRVSMRSCGGWGYPPNAKCVLTLERGVLSSVLLDVSKDGLSPELVNVDRIQAAIEEEYRRWGSDARIDSMRLEEGLRTLGFRGYHVRRIERSPFEIRTLVPKDIGAPELTEESTSKRIWYTDDQTSPRCTAVIAGEYLVWAPLLGPGETRKFWRISDGDSGKVETMTLSRDEEGHGRYHVTSLRCSPTCLGSR